MITFEHNHIITEDIAHLLRSGSSTLFFRDDDTGVDNAGLVELIDVFAARDVPVSVGVTPAGLDRETQNLLSSLMSGDRRLIEIHQHGYSHANYGTERCKYEFGPSRTEEEQRGDLMNGRERLCEAFGEGVFKAFSAPWNRLSDVTISALEALGFKVFSRSLKQGGQGSAKKPTGLSAQLVEYSVSVDMYNWKERRCAAVNEIQRQIEAAAKRPAPLGIITHHALMDGPSRELLGVLLDELGRIDAVTFHTFEGLYRSSKEVS